MRLTAIRYFLLLLVLVVRAPSSVLVLRTACVVCTRVNVHTLCQTNVERAQTPWEWTRDSIVFCVWTLYQQVQNYRKYVI